MRTSGSDEGPSAPGPVDAVALVDPGAGDQVDPLPTAGEGRRAVSGGLWNAAATVLPMASTLLLSVVINRTLGLDAQGAQNFIAYVASLAVALPVMSLFSASVQAQSAARGRRDEDHAAWLARASLWLHVVVGTVAAAVLVLIGLERGDAQLVWAVAGATVAIDAVSWALTARCVAREGWARVGARRLVTQSAAPLLGVVALLAGFGVAGVFLAQAVASAALLVSVAQLHRGPAGGRRVPLLRPPLPVRPLVGLVGMFALVSLLTQVVGRRMEVLFLDAYSSDSEIAVYSIAFSLVSLAYYVCTSSTGAAGSSIAALLGSGEHERVEQAVSRASRVLLVTAVLLAAALASVGPPLVRQVYTDAERAAQLVPWLCLTLLLAPVSHLLQVYWEAVGRLGPVLLSGSLGAVVNIALAFALVPGFGAAGAVAANVSGQALAAAVILVLTRRRLPGLSVPGGLLLRAVAVALPSGAAGVAAAGLGGWWGLVAAAAGFTVVALGASRLVRTLGADDVAWLTTALPAPLGRAALVLLTPGLPSRARR